MRAHDTDDVRAWVEMVADARSDIPPRAETNAALIYTREGIPARASLKDLADSTAHPVRDKGRSLTHMNRFAQEVRRFVSIGGTMRFELLFPIAQVISELNAALAAAYIASPLDNSSQTHRVRLAFALALALGGTRATSRSLTASSFMHRCRRPREHHLWIASEMFLNENITERSTAPGLPPNGASMLDATTIQ
ncbi:hypothetical protein MN032_04450 [Agromyces atrinae]|uniref:hypothetical protein n=1 Tax=Agromyces atrinae TaxID=592376 RepID=UPI001F589BC9|nr:hypothetical protein [Agromyces atrinae]MCI2956934.1 hypothetical protein [Agromyces atrinae]